MSDRFERQMRFFGKAGQERLALTKVTVIGVGGLGTHVLQQLALLGVGKLTLVDSEELASTDRNRYVGAHHDDPIPGTRKVDIGERIVKEIDSQIVTEKIHDSLISQGAFEAVRRDDYIFGCVDSEGARLVLNELCAAYSRPYWDLASDIVPGDPPNYGGRVCVTSNGQGCIVCFDLLDIAEAQADLGGPQEQRVREALYGVKHDALGQSGPSVVSINGVVASLAVTEFMVTVTGIRPPKKLIKYLGNIGKVVVSTDDPHPDCYYCKGVWGRGDSADVERYIKAGVGQYLR